MNTEGKVIVLLTQGHHNITDHATVYLFDSIGDAEDFCTKNTNGKITGWVRAQIVEHAVSVELVNVMEDLYHDITLHHFGHSLKSVTIP